MFEKKKWGALPLWQVWALAPPCWRVSATDTRPCERCLALRLLKDRTTPSSYPLRGWTVYIMLHLNKGNKMLGKENKNIVFVFSLSLFCYFISLKLYLVMRESLGLCAWQDVVKCPTAPNNNNRKKNYSNICKVSLMFYMCESAVLTLITTKCFQFS